MNYLSIIISIKIHAVGRRRAPKVPFALKPVNNTKGARGAFGAAGASTEPDRPEPDRPEAYP